MFWDSNIVDVGFYEELKEVIKERNWVRGFWVVSDEDEVWVKEEMGVINRCYFFE